MKEKINKLRAEFLQLLEQASDKDKLHELEVRFLSRKGELSEILRD
jgi:hypothetical protein